MKASMAATLEDKLLRVLTYQYDTGNFEQGLVDFLTLSRQGRLPASDARFIYLYTVMLDRSGLPRQARKISRDYGRVLVDHVHFARIQLYQAYGWYDEGNYDELRAAISSLKSIDDPLIVSELRVLHVRMLLAQGKLQQAVALIEETTDASLNLNMLRYDVAMKSIEAGSLDPARRLLDFLISEAGVDAYSRELREKALTSVGFLEMKAGDPARAVHYFQQVRLDSLDSNRALLGLGWAEMNRGNEKRALTAWRNILEQQQRNSAMNEARVGVPFLYARLGDLASAEGLYRSGLENFDEQRRLLANFMAEDEPSSFIEQCLAQNVTANDGLAECHIARSLEARSELAEHFRFLRELAFNRHALALLKGEIDSWLSLTQGTSLLPSPALRQLQTEYDLLLREAGQHREVAKTSSGLSARQKDEFKLLKELAMYLRRSVTARRDRGLMETYRRTKGLWIFAQARPAQRKVQPIDGSLAVLKNDIDALFTQAASPAGPRLDVAKLEALQKDAEELDAQMAILQKEARREADRVMVVALKNMDDELKAYAAQARLLLAQLYEKQIFVTQ